MEDTHYFEIHRVSKDIDFDTFYHKFFVLEMPVIIEGVGVDWRAITKWNTQYLQETLSRELSVENNKAFFTMDENTLGSDYDIPDVINMLLRSTEIFPQRKNTRIWINSRNNTSMVFNA